MNSEMRDLMEREADTFRVGFGNLESVIRHGRARRRRRTFTNIASGVGLTAVVLGFLLVRGAVDSITAPTPIADSTTEATESGVPVFRTSEVPISHLAVATEDEFLVLVSPLHVSDIWYPFKLRLGMVPSLFVYRSSDGVAWTRQSVTTSAFGPNTTFEDARYDHGILTLRGPVEWSSEPDEFSGSHSVESVTLYRTRDLVEWDTIRVEPVAPSDPVAEGFQWSATRADLVHSEPPVVAFGFYATPDPDTFERVHGFDPQTRGWQYTNEDGWRSGPFHMTIDEVTGGGPDQQTRYWSTADIEMPRQGLVQLVLRADGTWVGVTYSDADGISTVMSYRDGTSTLVLRAGQVWIVSEGLIVADSGMLLSYDDQGVPMGDSSDALSEVTGARWVMGDLIGAADQVVDLNSGPTPIDLRFEGWTDAPVHQGESSLDEWADRVDTVGFQPFGTHSGLLLGHRDLFPNEWWVFDLAAVR